MPDDKSKTEFEIDDSVPEWTPPPSEQRPFADVDLKDEDAEVAIRTKGEDGEDEPYSNKVKKRIKRAEQAGYNRALATIRAEIEERDAARDAELKELRNQLAKTQSVRITKELDDKIADLEAKLVEAQEAGETKKAVALNRELAELIAEKKVATIRAESPDDVIRPEARTAKRNNPKADAWVEANPWWGIPAYRKAVAEAIAIDKRLMSEGSDPRSDEHYEKLAEELKEKFPKLKITNPFEQSDEFGSLDADDDDDEDEAPQPRRQSAPRQGERRVPGQEDRQRREVLNGRVRLTAADKANMVRFKLDPENPEHVKSYAKFGKYGTAVAESRRGR